MAGVASQLLGVDDHPNTCGPWGGTRRMDVKGAIKVRDLSFRYGASDQFIL